MRADRDDAGASAPRGPLRVANAAGLALELDPDGGVRTIRHGDDVVNLFQGNGMEPGPANLWLRLHGGGGVEAVPLLGPQSPLEAEPDPGGFRSRGSWRGIEIEVRLSLAGDRAAWCWQVALVNRRPGGVTVDLVHAQDLALASLGAVRLNEFYVSQYLDLSPLSHPRCGWTVAARQNQAQGKRHPWALVGSVRRAVSYATDGLQLHGLEQRMGLVPRGVAGGLPGVRLQHEHAMAALQDEPAHLAPGGRWQGGFFAVAQADHPAATSAADQAAVDEALAWVDTLAWPRSAVEPAPAAPRARSLFATAPLLDAFPLPEAELRRLFGADWRHEEREGGELLSFFCGEDAHVVLRAKEARTQRPHGHLLRTGQALVPEEAGLTSTVWMAGVFHSMVTQGHVAINRFLSTARGWLSQFRSQGLRLFVRGDGGWRQLGVPSAFEMRPGACRWIYRHEGGALEVVSAIQPGTHRLSLRGRVLEGPPLAWLATLHLALGGDDGSGGAPVPWRLDGSEVLALAPPGSELHARFPGGGFAVTALPGTALTGVAGDARLFPDGQSRGLPFLCLEGEACSCFGLEIAGRLVPEVRGPPAAVVLPRLRAPGEGAASWEVRRLAEMLPWLRHDALVHYLSPRGLEQFSGGGWGTRDACQGPLEMLLALDQGLPARDLLTRVLANQNADGDWPQWFQFFERERHLRASDAHGDVVFWPLLGVARYLLATGDAAFLDEVIPFHAPPGAAPTSGTVERHLERALEVVAGRRVAGTALAAYGHGDWNDSLQPADPALRDRLCSAWTVTLHHQTLTTLARALRLARRGPWAAALEEEAAQVARDFRRLLMPDGVITGYLLFGPGEPEPLIHPRDRQTGLRYSLLPMMHAVLEGLCTPAEAASHHALMRTHLWGPDGARLFDRPLPYRGGPERLFQRAESAAFFGREIGIMYTHAHLRYAQMQAHLGDGRGLLRSLALAHPVLLRERLPQASLRQANCYFSSSDAAFRDRYEALTDYDKVGSGEVALDGGWRVYSSGPGIALGILTGSMLGVRREGESVVFDPVLAPELRGLRAEVPLLGRSLLIEYQVERNGCGPRSLILDGRPLPFTRVANPYRPGGAAVPVELLAAALRRDEPSILAVDLG